MQATWGESWGESKYGGAGRRVKDVRRWESALPYEMLLKNGRTLFSTFFLIPLKSSCGFKSVAGHDRGMLDTCWSWGALRKRMWRLGTPLGRVGVTELPLSVSPCIFLLLSITHLDLYKPRGPFILYFWDTLPSGYNPPTFSGAGIWDSIFF